jgi:class 3 adenylate cyclase
LIVHAKRDVGVPIEAARLARDLIPGAALVELDSDIHLLWLSDQVDEITQAIEAFIGRAVPVAGSGRALATVLVVAPTAGGLSENAAAIIERWQGEPLRESGRAIFAGPARAIRCAHALVAEATVDGRPPGVAVHSGECQFDGGGATGVAVDLAAQLAAVAEPGQVLVSQTIRDLLIGSGARLEPHRGRPFAGLPGDWETFVAVSPP